MAKSLAIEQPLISYWYQALNSQYGIELVCSNAENFRQRLYAARAEVRDPDLDKLHIFLSPFDRSKLWLTKRKPKNAKA